MGWWLVALTAALPESVQSVMMSRPTCCRKLVVHIVISHDKPARACALHLHLRLHRGPYGHDGVDVGQFTRSTLGVVAVGLF